MRQPLPSVVSKAMRMIVKGDKPADLRGFAAYADRKLVDAVDEGISYGQRRMTELVPKGSSHRLASAVMSEGPTIIAPGHITGRVVVDQEIAPHAGMVDKGTGVDGPFHMPVTITRTARKSSRPGTMMFQKKGEGAKFRTQVKIHPSSKIEQGKNFSGRTFDSMVQWTRIRVGFLAGQLASYFARH
jgi:hypothetical protein